MRTAALLLAIAAPAAATEPRRSCASDHVPYGRRYGRFEAWEGCWPKDITVEARTTFFCHELAWWRLWCTEMVCQPCELALGTHEPTKRLYRDLSLEQERKENARRENHLATEDDVDGEEYDGDLLEGDFASSLKKLVAVQAVESWFKNLLSTGKLAFAWVNTWSSNFLFRFTNFVDGFRDGDAENGVTKWNKPVAGERVGVVSFADQFAGLKNDFSSDYPFFKEYFTGGRVPSWEDNEEHKKGMGYLDVGIALARNFGFEPIESLYDMSDRFAFDNEGIIKATWNGFKYLKARDVAMASNGVHGVKVVESYGTRDTLGVLMTDSVFSAHLVYNSATDRYELDLSNLEGYTPLEGYMKIGGKAVFKLDKSLNRLNTTELVFFGETFSGNFHADAGTEAAYQNNQLVGWRKAEKAIIASLLSLTNLVMHVKDLHLELAAAFQAVSVDSFADDVDHPLSRLLRPFIHRSIQATNDNFKLLFDYNAAEFSLSPLPTQEQLKLIDTFIKDEPLALEDLDMANYAAKRNMPAEATGAHGFWRWHKRTAAIEAMYAKMMNCYIDANWATEAELLNDVAVQKWWGSMFDHIPALKRVNPDNGWAGRTLTRKGLVNVLKVMTTWLSWVHEDVGHSAAAYVYNPVHTPMAVPADGKGIPFRMVSFNVAAYRGFVFLNRAKLLDAPPADWHVGKDEQCYLDFQEALRDLGDNNPDFAKCGADGFYSCVDQVETAVSS